MSVFLFTSLWYTITSLFTKWTPPPPRVLTPTFRIRLVERDITYSQLPSPLLYCIQLRLTTPFVYPHSPSFALHLHLLPHPHSHLHLLPATCHLSLATGFLTLATGLLLNTKQRPISPSTTPILTSLASSDDPLYLSSLQCVTTVEKRLG